MQKYLDGIEDGSYLQISDSFVDQEGTADGVDVWIRIPIELERTLSPNNHKFVKTFEKEVLNPTGYQIVNYRNPRDTGRIGFEIILNLTNLKARTEMVKKPRFLYHITSPHNEKSILKKGLVPKDGPGDFGTRYKSRVYLIAQDPKQWKSDILTGIPVPVTEHNFIIFRVDTRKFNRFNIFRDLESYRDDSNSVWTPTHIPTKALKLVYRISDKQSFWEWTKSVKS